MEFIEAVKKNPNQANVVCKRIVKTKYIPVLEKRQLAELVYKNSTTMENGIVKVDFKGDTRLLDENVNIDEIKKVLNDSLKQFNEVENVVLLVNSNEL